MIFISIFAISKLMILDYEPGDKVNNPNHKDWGIGQVQSIINGKVTVNFENVGKKVINTEIIRLEKIYK
jgi:transcription elongation factor GreA-like protein